MAYGGLGQALALSQRWDEAENALTHAASMARERNTGFTFLPRTLVCLARSHLAKGEIGPARATLAEAIELIDQVAATYQVPRIEAELVQAQLWLRTEGTDARQRIEEILESVASWIEETGARAYAPAVHELRAELAELLGDEAARAGELREAHRLCVEMGAIGHAERLKKELGL
jgi:ATP/maltotriose-dependent transcriptional regulator MalT